MPDNSPIVAIVRDSALLRSLAFALEAHGYRVKPFQSWSSARESVSKTACIILDGSLPLPDRRACLETLASGVAVVLLAEDETQMLQRGGLQVLRKPLSGTDLLNAVVALRKAP